MLSRAESGGIGTVSSAGRGTALSAEALAMVGPVRAMNNAARGDLAVEVVEVTTDLIAVARLDEQEHVLDEQVELDGRFVAESGQRHAVRWR